MLRLFWYLSFSTCNCLHLKHNHLKSQSSEYSSTPTKGRLSQNYLCWGHTPACSWHLKPESTWNSLLIVTDFLPSVNFNRSRVKWHLVTHTISAAVILLLPVRPPFMVSKEAVHVSEFNFEALISPLCIWVRKTSHTSDLEGKWSPLPLSNLYLSLFIKCLW